MKCARLFAPLDVRIVESETPSPGPGEVLLRVRACAICASDLHMYEEGHSSGVYPSGPIVLGHEFAGEVAALGEGVSRWSVGQRVACEPTWHCGHCDMCQRSLTNLCRNVIFPSYPDRDGALAEYIACPEHSLALLPDTVDFITGALAEPLGVALHAARRAAVGPGMKVAIIGAGAIGLCVMAVCRAFGVTEIMVAEPVEGRRQVAADCGCTVGSSAKELAEMCSPGEEPEIVFEAAGADTTFAEALGLTRPAGTAIILGIPTQDSQVFSAREPRRKELTIRFCRRSRDTLHECLDMLGTGAVDLSPLPLRTFSLDQTIEALKASQGRPGDMVRAMVEP